MNLLRANTVSFVISTMTLPSHFLIFFFGLLALRAAEVSSFGRNAVKALLQTCDDPGVPMNGFRVGEDFSYKAKVEYFCNPGFRLTAGTRLRHCQLNKKWSGTLPTCEDINECIEYEDYENPYTTNDVQVEHNHLCHAKATCFNTIGSFHCKCKLGYRGDGKLCLSNKYRMVAALFRKKTKVSPHTCGTLGNSKNATRIRRIVGGISSDDGAWPWQVAISYNSTRRKSYLFNGALIKPGWVLTVANVLQVKKGVTPLKPNRLQVVLGEFNRNKLDGTETPVSVKRIVLHPGYDRSTMANNIALLELEKPVRLNDHIRMVCVPKRKRDKILEKPLQFGTVAGWGSTKAIRLGEPTGPLSAELRHVTVPIVPDKECKEATIYSFDKETTLCAGFKKKPKDPCFGDVGSPLVVQHPRSGRWIVIGLFGWSEGCGRPRKYAYYTRVSKYRKWINFIVRGGQ